MAGQVPPFHKSLKQLQNLSRSISTDTDNRMSDLGKSKALGKTEVVGEPSSSEVVDKKKIAAYLDKIYQSRPESRTSEDKHDQAFWAKLFEDVDGSPSQHKRSKLKKTQPTADPRNVSSNSVTKAAGTEKVSKSKTKNVVKTIGSNHLKKNLSSLRKALKEGQIGPSLVQPDPFKAQAKARQNRGFWGKPNGVDSTRKGTIIKPTGAFTRHIPGKATQVIPSRPNQISSTVGTTTQIVKKWATKTCTENENEIDSDMAKCPTCQRTFLKERIETHSTICNKYFKRVKRVYDPVLRKLVDLGLAHQLNEERRRRLPKRPPLPDWKIGREEFKKSIRSAKEAAKQVALRNATRPDIPYLSRWAENAAIPTQGFLRNLQLPKPMMARVRATRPHEIMRMRPNFKKPSGTAHEALNTDELEVLQNVYSENKSSKPVKSN